MFLFVIVFVWLSLPLSFRVDTLFFLGYFFLVRFIFLSFSLLFFSPATVFPVWFGLVTVYLVTTAGFVADQL